MRSAITVTGHVGPKQACPIAHANAPSAHNAATVLVPPRSRSGPTASAAAAYAAATDP